MSLALLFLYLMLNKFRMLIHLSSGACDLFVELFHGLYCSGSVYVGVTLWFGWGGVVSVCRLKHYSLYSTVQKLLIIRADIRSFYIVIIIIIIIIFSFFVIVVEFLTSQLWLGNIHISWDVVISDIRLNGLTCSLKSFLQLNMCEELLIFSVVYVYWGAG